MGHLYHGYVSHNQRVISVDYQIEYLMCIDLIIKYTSINEFWFYFWFHMLKRKMKTSRPVVARRSAATASRWCTPPRSCAMTRSRPKPEEIASGKFNIAIENGPFIDGLPIKNGPFNGI